MDGELFSYNTLKRLYQSVTIFEFYLNPDSNNALKMRQQRHFEYRLDI